MTYREKIQLMIKLIDNLYDDAETMRDLATTEEQVFWNEHREIFNKAGAPLRKLDNSLTPERANRTIYL